jgi:hypothetical protein
MQTTIIYNGITIRDVLTDGIQHETVKDSTGVDQIGVRVTIDCTGIVHISDQGIPRGIRVGTLAIGLNEALTLLTKDRRPLRMTIGNLPLYEVYPGAVEPGTPPGNITVNLHQMDIEHGPRPSVQVLDIKAGYSATIRFRVSFTIPNCGVVRGGARSTNGLINFRYWIAEDIDCKTWLTTRTYTGKIRVAHAGVNPHVFARTIALPPQQRGFKRSVVGLHQAESGLELDFTVVDQEIEAAPPYDANAKKGATDWDGTLRILSTNGILSHVEFNVTLTGPKSTKKPELLTLAMKVFTAKTHYLELRNKGGAFLEHFAAEERLPHNQIGINARMRCTAPQSELIALFGPGGQNELGKPLGNLGIGYDPEVAFLPTTTATLTGLFLARLQIPCAPGSMPQVTDQTPERDESQQSREGQRDDPYSSQLPKYADGEQLTGQHYESMYLDYRLDSELIHHRGAIAMPTGVSPEDTRSLTVVTLHEPTALRQIRLEASRVSKPPELPDFREAFDDRNGITHTRIGKARIISGAPQLSADSRKLLYFAELHVSYALSRVPRSSEAIPVGCLPYRTAGENDASRVLPPEIFLPPKKVLA